MIDLFAGAGGLSLGFRQTGRFDIKAFVEKNRHAADTYKKNFRGVDWYEDIQDVDFKALNEKYGGIDVVIGGPPCQGFSNANRQHNQAINLNNKLVKQYIRAVLDFRPKAFVMENVSMLKSDVHRFYIENEDEDAIQKYKIRTKPDSIFLLDQKYIFDGAEELVADSDSVKKNRWDDTLYMYLNIWLKDSANSSKLEAAIDRHIDTVKKLINKHVPVDNQCISEADNELFHFIIREEKLKAQKAELVRLLKKPLAYQKMLLYAQEIHDNNIGAAFAAEDDSGNPDNLKANVRSCAVYDYLTGILEAGENGYAINKGILSSEEFGIPQKRRRFVLIGVKKKFAEEVEMPEPPRMS